MWKFLTLTWNITFFKIYRSCWAAAGGNTPIILCFYLLCPSRGEWWEEKKIENQLEKSLSSRPCRHNSRLSPNEIADTGSMWRTPWRAASHLPARNSPEWSQNHVCCQSSFCRFKSRELALIQPSHCNRHSCFPAASCSSASSSSSSGDFTH